MITILGISMEITQFFLEYGVVLGACIAGVGVIITLGNILRSQKKSDKNQPNQFV